LKKGKNMATTDESSKNTFAAVQGLNLRWTNAVIPYVIDCSLENLPDAVDAIKKSMAEWEAKTCIRFVKHTNEKYKLTFFRDTHCWGNVGMTSYTRISVGYGCEYQNVMTHEIGHVVGFYHEQNRKDRDGYVDVHWENIGQFKDAFDIVKNTDSLGVPYDYESIMHYPWNAFSSNGKNTMTPKRDLKGKQPYVELSKLDAEQTSHMYNCPAIERKRALARNKRHIGEIKRNKRGVDECIDKNQYCPDWAQVGHCSKSTYVQENCKLSCGSPTACQGTICVDNYADCPSWESIGHCSLNPTVAKECQKSCNPFCKGRPTVPPTKTPTKPPVTRPVTTQPPTQKPDGGSKRTFLGKGLLCIDSYNECAKWASQGECQNNAGWMLRNCLKSCNSKNCDNGIQKPQGSCANPLGLAMDEFGKYKLPDSAFSAPTGWLAPGAGWKAHPSNARLYMGDDFDDKRIGAFCSSSHDAAKSSTGYLQVDLGQQKTINYIATQGRDKYFERVDKFKISYSNDGQIFQMYQDNGKQDKMFEGNCDHVTPVLNRFTTPIKARYIRYHPWTWNYPCVRMELYGC